MLAGVVEKLSASKPDRVALRRQDLELWKKWDSGGKKPDDLRPLLNNFRGMIRSHSNKYTGNVELPPAAIQAEFTDQFVNALNTYNPNKGAALGTWVNTNLQKGKRYITKYQNPARIGEQRVYKIGQYQGAIAQLDSQFGREPTHFEVAEHLGWAPKEVERMGTEIRKSYVASAGEMDPSTIMPSKEKEALDLVRYDLSPHEFAVYEYTLGIGGKPQLKPKQIALKLGFSPSKVTRLRQSVYDKTQKILI